MTDHRGTRSSTPTRRRAGRLAAAAIATLGLAVGVVGVGAVQAAPPTEDPATAAGYGARWLAAQFDPAGFVPTATDTPNVSRTLEFTVALAAAGVEEATFDQALTWLQANVETVIVVDGNDDPGRLGYLMLIAEAAGIDPDSFGGVDLPARLLATEGELEPGLFGAADPTYDGAFRQSIAITGLVAAGATVPATASGWLVDQQCDDATPAAAGGWQAYRADTSQPCDAPDPDTYTGADTNATSGAIMALEALGPFAGTDEALDFLAAAQATDGGFPYVAGGATDPNSTALVILALVAAGEDPTAGRWVQTADPVTSLLSWQVGCDAAAADRGGFASPFSAGAPDPIASGQAVWGAAGEPFPLAGPVAFAAAPVPCLPPTTTTTTAPSTTTTVVTTSTTIAPTPAAQAVVAQPTLAG